MIYFRETSNEYSEVANLESMVSVHGTTLLGHITKMRTSFFDTDFASQMKLTKLPLIYCFETSLLNLNIFCHSNCVFFTSLLWWHVTISWLITNAEIRELSPSTLSTISKGCGQWQSISLSSLFALRIVARNISGCNEVIPQDVHCTTCNISCFVIHIVVRSQWKDTKEIVHCKWMFVIAETLTLLSMILVQRNLLVVT